MKTFVLWLLCAAAFVVVIFTDRRPAKVATDEDWAVRATVTDLDKNTAEMYQSDLSDFLGVDMTEGRAYITIWEDRHERL